MNKENKAFPWENKIINHQALGGIETAVLDNGPAAGTRLSPARARVRRSRAIRDGAVADDEVDIGETAPAPKKVAKKKEVAAPSSEEADLSSIVDDWDD